MKDEQSIKTIESTRNKMFLEWSIFVVAASFIFIIFAMLAQQLPIGVDYHFTFRPVARDWLDGKTQLYDEKGHGYFNAPWALILIIPLSLPSFVIGQALWNSLSLFGLVAAIHLWRQHRSTPTYAVIAALLNFHTFDLFVRVQVDALILLGIVIGWGAIQLRKPWVLSFAFCLMAIKPVNIILVGVLFLIAVRSWSRKELTKVIALPVILVIFSGFFFGFDWLIRYIQFVQDTPRYDQISITLWDLMTFVGLSQILLLPLILVAILLFLRYAWQVGSTMWMFSVATTTNLVFTTYANGNHYVLLIPALLLLSTHNKWLFILAYLSTFTPLSRIALGSDYSWVDIFYPIILLLASWYFGLKTDMSAPVSTAVPNSPPVHVVPH